MDGNHAFRTCHPALQRPLFQFQSVLRTTGLGRHSVLGVAFRLDFIKPTPMPSAAHPSWTQGRKAALLLGASLCSTLCLVASWWAAPTGSR